MKENAISLHSTCVGAGNLLTLAEAARAAGYDSIEPNILQIDAFLNAGYTVRDLREALGPLEIAAMGWLEDCERQGDAYTEMLAEAEHVFSTAADIGAQAVQVTNGPVDWHAVDAFRKGIPFDGYQGLLGLEKDEIIRRTGENLRELADLAAQYQLMLYLEPLGWSPAGSIQDGVQMCQIADRDNMKIMIDFWHGYVAGDTLEFISQIDPALICGVHVCDGLPHEGGIPVEELLRDVPLGEGVIPVSEWIAAVKATGYRGWWTYETFSRKETQREPFRFAAELLVRMRTLVR